MIIIDFIFKNRKYHFNTKNIDYVHEEFYLDENNNKRYDVEIAMNSGKSLLFKDLDYEKYLKLIKKVNVN